MLFEALESCFRFRYCVAFVIFRSTLAPLLALSTPEAHRPPSLGTDAPLFCAGFLCGCHMRLRAASAQGEPVGQFGRAFCACNKEHRGGWHFVRPRPGNREVVSIAEAVSIRQVAGVNPIEIRPSTGIDAHVFSLSGGGNAGKGTTPVEDCDRLGRRSAPVCAECNRPRSIHPRPGNGDPTICLEPAEADAVGRCASGPPGRNCGCRLRDRVAEPLGRWPDRLRRGTPELHPAP